VHFGRRAGLQAGGSSLQIFTLSLPRLFWCQFQSQHISLRREAARTGRQPAQRLAELQLVDARAINLSFYLHQAVKTGLRTPVVPEAEDRDDIARLQGKIFGRIVLQNCLAQVEGQGPGRDAVGIQSLDRGALPVGFVHQAANGQLCFSGVNHPARLTRIPAFHDAQRLTRFGGLLPLEELHQPALFSLSNPM
jgi:hypothetical protein